MRAKTLITATLTASLILAASSAAYAGSWKQDETGKWWDNGDGTYPTSSWQWLDDDSDGIAECYYFDEVGYLAVSQEVEGYEVDQDGAWVSGNKVQNKYVSITETKEGTYIITDGEYLVGFDIEPGEYNVYLTEGSGTWKYTRDVDDEAKVSKSKKFSESGSGTAVKRYNNLVMEEDGVLTVPKGLIIRIKSVD